MSIKIIEAFKHAKLVSALIFSSFQISFQDVGRTESMMTDRDTAYLIAHNKRRIQWHSDYNKAYVPLKWSKGEPPSLFIRIFFCHFFSHLFLSSLGLKDSSMVYAEKLLTTCLISLPEHEPNNPYGENLARNKGEPSTWGQLYSKSFIFSCCLLYVAIN